MADSTDVEERAALMVRLAMDLARQAAERGNRPFVALIEDSEGVIIAAERNRERESHDPTAHAEVNAIRVACRARATLRLPGHRLYTNAQPCPMCLVAMSQAEIAAVYYGAPAEPNTWGGSSPLALLEALGRHELLVHGGVLEKDAVAQRASLTDREREAPYPSIGKNRPSQIDHVSGTVRDMDSARRFYASLLGELSFEESIDPHGRVEYRRDGSSDFGIYSDVRQFFQRPHVAFAAVSRADVDRSFAAGLAAGGVSLDDPRVRPEFGGVYSAYVEDPEGTAVEIICRG